MVGVGVAVGPISGGWLLEHFWWGSIFMVNIPIAVITIAGGMLFVPTSHDPAAARVDVPGLLLSAAGITALVYTVIEAPARGWTSDRTAIGFGLATMVLVAFALWERRSSHPMVDVSVFADRRFSGGSLAVTAGFLTLFGFIFVITQYFQFIKEYRAFETGVRLLPVALSIALASILGPRLVERIGTTAVVAAGLGVFAAAWPGRRRPMPPRPIARSRCRCSCSAAGSASRPHRPPRRSWAPFRPTRPGSARPSTTPPANSAVPSAWPSWAVSSRPCTRASSAPARR
ncbi:major Facilitator Superfamily protein [Mycobacterium kansasii]|uniref:Major Facilitator Superfamily protein n=1 Tax=Mycobacterium kansasii TaxID=1768 RepID=A0A1V3XXT2_MYCKA|nr:major Facilitator Superfamily protein [Mycobacterium kansasii]